MRKGTVVTMVALAAWLVGCAPDDGVGGSEPSTPATAQAAGSTATDPTASASSPSVSPSVLPTLQAPTAPPSAPTDVTPGDVVAGRVTALADGCLEVTTDDAVVWSLTGDLAIAVAVGDSVIAKIEALPGSEQSCGPGRGAALASIEVAGA